MEEILLARMTLFMLEEEGLISPEISSNVLKQIRSDMASGNGEMSSAA